MHKKRLKYLCILSGVIDLFIERVRQLLKEKGMYGKDMLADLEINKNQLTRWEKEDTVPTKAVLIAIADYLETTPEYLLGETDIKEKPVADDELSQNNVKFIGRNGTVIYKRVSPEFIKILESIPDTDEDL